MIAPRGIDGTGDGRRGLKLPFVGAAIFFAVAPLLSLLANPPDSRVALGLLLLAWAIFVAVLASLLRRSPFEHTEPQPMLAIAIALIAGIAVVVQVVFHLDQGIVLYFYAGGTAARLGSERWALTAIAVLSLAAGVATWWADGDLGGGVTTGVTVGTISLTLYALSALGRANRELHAARSELAALAVGQERSRIARDLHDTLGHTLSLIALKSELARRVMADDPARAAAEIADVETAARDGLASVRETVSGYRRPSLAMELAGARTALDAAGIENVVEPAPDDLPPEVEAMLGWAVREGVTNVLRHTDASRASIRVLSTGGRRAIEVVDDGTARRRPDDPGTGANGRGGMGLDGLRERAATLGGDVEAGPLPDRGFRLRVSVPLPAEAVG